MDRLVPAVGIELIQEVDDQVVLKGCGAYDDVLFRDGPVGAVGGAQGLTLDPQRSKVLRWVGMTTSAMTIMKPTKNLAGHVSGTMSP